jgi:cystathionine beta-lyase/cystathionine gamma-synthase
MPPDDQKDGMEMRGGQDKRVSNTAVLTAYEPRSNERAVQPHMVEAATYQFGCPVDGQLAFACALNLTDTLAHLDPNGKKKAARIYARLSTSSVEAVERTMLKLEPESKWALLFPSGMNAISTLVLSVCHKPHGGDTPEGNVKREKIQHIGVFKIIYVVRMVSVNKISEQC